MYVAMIIVFMIALSGCGPKPEVRTVKVDKSVKDRAYTNCVKEKESEVDNSTEASKRYSWKPEEIKEYCTEQWRGYRD